MLNIKYLREHPEDVKASEKRRGHDPKQVDYVLKLDADWRAEKVKAEKLRQMRNSISQDVNKAKKAKDEKLASKKIKEMQTHVSEMKKQEEKLAKVLEKRNKALKDIGNVLDESVPSGKDDSENVELKKVGKIPTFDFPIKDHIELAESLDLIDLDIAASVSGARFYYLKNEAVLLDMALQRYAIDLLMSKGFSIHWTPFMLNRGALEGGVNLSEFEDTIYKIEDEDLYLIATSEHSLIALQKDKVILEKDLPLRLGGVSTCFRKEAGSHGRDTKGIFRVHQFNKIEEIIYCTPETSAKYFKEAQAISEELFSSLGIPFRVVQICTGDIGNKQNLQYDIEAWFPGQKKGKGAYREVTSCSNCTDYQTTTLNTKFLCSDGGEKKYAHIINNTAIATSRAIVAILENFQTAKGTVKIPKVLWPYMSGVKEIKKK